MGKKGKAKGKRFENTVARVMSEAYGLQLRRTPLSGGWADGMEEVAGDLVCVDPDYELEYCIECKNAEGWRLESLFTDNRKWFEDWWQQTVDECPDDKYPFLVFSRNRVPIFVASTLDVMWGYPYKHLRIVLNDEPIIVGLLEDFLKWEVRDENGKDSC